MVLGSGIRDPRSGIRKNPIPDPGSRIQGSKSTQSRIPDPDPQHWLYGRELFIILVMKLFILADFLLGMGTGTGEADKK